MTTYGKTNKKILFYDTDKRHAELKIKLEYDGLGQSEFFRALVTGYLSEDDDIIDYITRFKQTDGKQSKRQQAVTVGEREEDKRTRSIFAEDEIENIFNIIEKENPDL